MVTRAGRVPALILWTAVLAAVVAALLGVRGRLDKAHVALVLLLVVLFGAARAGRLVGLWLATASFLGFNWFFLPPYGTFAIRDPLDWLVLAVFLITGVVAAQLLAHAQERSSLAEHAAALREADHLKDALLASVSHDLRTPLTTIKALAHDLQALGDERAEIIEHEADRLNRVVADLLDLSRLSSGGLALRVELNAVDELLGAVLQQVEPSLGDRRVVVTLPADDPLLLGRFDLVHSVRVLVNLVGNAAKYAAGADPIELRAVRRDAMIDVTVLDRGPGVPPTEVERIFEPFYRPEGSPPDVGSAGLGLSIARRIAEAQGGSLTYAPRDGGGSAFTLALRGAELSEAGAPPRA